jgi:hypothetical protein
MSPSSQLFAVEEEHDYSEPEECNRMEYGDISPSVAGPPFPPMPSDGAISGGDGDDAVNDTTDGPQVPSTPKGSSVIPPLTPKSSGSAGVLPPLLSPPMPLPTDKKDGGAGVEKQGGAGDAGGSSLSRRRLPPGLNETLLNAGSAPFSAAASAADLEDLRAFQTLPSVVSWVGIMTVNPSGSTSSSTPSDAGGSESSGNATPSGTTPSSGRRRRRRLSTSAPPLDHK